MNVCSRTEAVSALDVEGGDAHSTLCNHSQPGVTRSNHHHPSIVFLNLSVPPTHTNYPPHTHADASGLSIDFA